MNNDKILNELANQLGVLSVNNTLLVLENKELREKITQLEEQIKTKTEPS